MLIHEEDCEIALPSSVEDRYIQPQGLFRSRVETAPFTGSIAAIHITRPFAELLQALKSSVMAPHVLHSFDERFYAKLTLLPENYQPNSNLSLEIAALPPIMTLLSARFHLHRRNFTTASHLAERVEALRRCTLVAQDTAKYISRALHSPPKVESERSWQTRVSSIASNMICMHTWRCVLILCFRGEYDAALMCLHLMSAIGVIRKVNGACGMNIVFFLERLLDRVRSGHGNFQTLEQDEEMIAYISGDAQGNLEQSWVWTGTDLGPSASPLLSPRHDMRAREPEDSRRERLHSQGDLNLSGHDEIPWDDWGRIEHMIRQLMGENRPRTAQLPAYYPSSHNPVKRIQLAPGARSPPRSAPLQSSAPSNSSRISIANII